MCCFCRTPQPPFAKAPSWLWLFPRPHAPLSISVCFACLPRIPGFFSTLSVGQKCRRRNGHIYERTLLRITTPPWRKRKKNANKLALRRPPQQSEKEGDRFLPSSAATSLPLPLFSCLLFLFHGSMFSSIPILSAGVSSSPPKFFTAATRLFQAPLISFPSFASHRRACRQSVLRPGSGHW